MLNIRSILYLLFFSLICRLWKHVLIYYPQGRPADSWILYYSNSIVVFVSVKCIANDGQNSINFYVYELCEKMAGKINRLSFSGAKNEHNLENGINILPLLSSFLCIFMILKIALPNNIWIMLVFVEFSFEIISNGFLWHFIFKIEKVNCGQFSKVWQWRTFCSPFYYSI